MSTNILLVEDEERLREVVKEYLEDEDFCIFEAADGKKALNIFKSMDINLALIDIMLPELDGWSLCKEIRKVSDIPIIIITARRQEDDKLLGFELGADDYVTKPFSVRVLVARVKTLLRRYNKIPETSSQKVCSGDLIIDYSGYNATINNENIGLTPKEFEILSYLIRHKGAVLSRQQMLDEIWGYDYYGNARIVDAHIKKVRKKMLSYGDKIKTVLGVGYKYEE